MKVKDLMALDLFQQCKLLTKSIGLENTINSAMVLEAVDIENWSKKGQLILTSFYAFNVVSGEEITEFFSKMKEMGVGGLVVKMDRLITMIPDWLIELCFEYKIPLIKAPEEVSYEKIMLTIYEPILNHQEHLLRTYYDVRQKFTKVERNLRSFDQIMETLHQLLGLSCTLKINDPKVNLHYGKRFNNYIVSNRWFLQTTEFTKNVYEKLILFSQVENQTVTALNTEFRSPFSDKCSLTIYQETEETKQTDIMIVENAIDLIHKQLQMEHILKRDRYARMNNLADAILQNTPKNTEELNSLLEEANLNNYPFYQGIAFIDKEDKPLINKKELIKKLRHLRPLEIYFDHYNYTVILFNLKLEKDLVTKEEIKNIFSEDKFFSQQLLFSLSQVKQKSGLKDILFECFGTIRFNRAFFIDYVTSIDDLGVFRFFLNEHELKQINLIVPKALAALQTDHNNLFETLHTFFKSNRSYKQTAEALFLDPKTIRYRLNKVEDLLAIDLTNPMQLVNYEIGTYLLMMKGRASNE